MSRAVRVPVVAAVRLLLGAVLLGAACFPPPHGEVMRGVDLKERQRVYVEQQHEKHGRDIALMVAERLRASGFQATSGPLDEEPQGIQALVSYEDLGRLLRLRIDFRDPMTNELLASGQSYFPSAKPEFVVDAVVTAILAGR